MGRRSQSRAVILLLLGACAFVALALLPSASAATESEPNNDIAHADSLYTDQVTTAQLNKSGDFADYYSVTGVRGDYVRIRVAATGSWPLMRSVATTDGTTTLVEWRLVGSAFESTFLLSEWKTLYFRVLVGDDPTSYSVSATVTATGLYEGPGPSIAGLIALQGAGVTVRPKSQPPFSLGIPYSTEGSLNLATGDGMLFGETLCVQTLIENRVKGVAVKAGDFYRPRDGKLQEMVVSRTMTFDVAASGFGCFIAMSRTTAGYLGRMSDLYDPAGMVTGDSLTLMKVIDQRHADGASGQLALWAVTSGTDEAGAKAWSASTNQIASARALLNAAGLHTALNPDYSWVGPVGAVVVVVLIAGVLGYFIGRDRLARRAPPPPPPASTDAWRPPPPPANRQGGTAGIASTWGARTTAPPSPPPPPQPSYSPTYLCPRCSAPLQAGRPVCPRCGLPL